MGREHGMGRSFAEVVASVAMGLSLEQGPETVLDTLLVGAQEVLEADARAFWELDLGRGGIVCRRSEGLPEAFLQAVGGHYERAQELQGTVVGELLKGQLVLVEDAGTDPRIHPIVAGAGYRAALFAPVRVDEVPHGALAYYYRAPHAFSPTDLEHAMGLASVAALVVRHTTIVQDQARALTEARLLLESSETITSSLSLDEILNEILELCPKSLGYVGCRIYLLEEDGLLRVRPQPDEASCRRLADLPRGLRLALETSEPQVVEDAAYLAKLGAAAGTPVGAALAVPLLVRGAPIGMFVVGRSTAGEEAFTRADLRLLKAMARHASVPLERARLLAGLERSKAELQALANSLEDRVAERTRALEDANHELLRAERMASLGRLAATVAHELRNPLAVVRTSAYYLRSRLRGHDEKVDRHLELIDHQVRLASKIISDILDFTRDVVPERAPMDVNKVVHSVLDRVALPAEVRLHLELSESLPTLQADEVHLEQCVRNLVHNAVEAMPEGGVLTLRTRAQGESVLVEVHDTGRGIAPEERERIFEPLYTTRPSGCGLGLTLTRKLIRGHRGEVELESEVGRGTTFRLVIPR